MNIFQMHKLKLFYNKLIFSYVDYLKNYSNLCNEKCNSKIEHYEAIKYGRNKIEDN